MCVEVRAVSAKEQNNATTLTFGCRGGLGLEQLPVLVAVVILRPCFHQGVVVGGNGMHNDVRLVVLEEL